MISGTLKVDGASRTFLLHLPTGTRTANRFQPRQQEIPDPRRQMVMMIASLSKVSLLEPSPSEEE
jgi:hypothetical protein